MTEYNHTYIKLPFMLWKDQYERFAGVLDDDSYRCEVPNSISSYPYKPHPQFTITIFGNKITIWSDVNNPQSSTGEGSQSSTDEGYEAVEKYLNERIRNKLGRPTAEGDYVALARGEYVEIGGMKTRVVEPCFYVFTGKEGWVLASMGNR